MFCPKCKCEYIEFIRHCKECDEKLVNELPKEIKSKEKYQNDFVVAKTYIDEIAVQIDKEILDNNGIFSLITGITVGQGSGMGILSEPEPIRLMVNKEDREHTRKLLDSQWSEIDAVEMNEGLPEELTQSEDGLEEPEEKNQFAGFLIKGLIFGPVILMLIFLIYMVFFSSK